MLAWAWLGKWDILSSVLGAELLRMLSNDLVEKTNCTLIKCTDVSLGAVGNSKIKTELERHICQKGGKNVQFCLDFKGKRAAFGAHGGGGDALRRERPQLEWGWIWVGAQGRSNLDGEMWERII